MLGREAQKITCKETASKNSNILRKRGKLSQMKKASKHFKTLCKLQYPPENKIVRKTQHKLQWPERFREAKKRNLEKKQKNLA